MSFVKNLAVAAALAIAIALVHDALRAERKAPPKHKRPIIIDRPYQVTHYRSMPAHAQT